MNQPSKPKRPTCSKCLRPQKTCICHWITRIAHSIEVLILQHPLEVDNAKGSARLLHLSLPHSRLVTGEIFDEQELQTLLYGTFPHPPPSSTHSRQTVKHTVLLYPDTPAEKATDNPPAPALDKALLAAPAQLRLIVLDGTWRKSRKMLYLNPLLQKLPRLGLRNAPASHYAIRKAHAPDQLSTLEAACYALIQLEQNKQKYQPLLTAFEGFVAQQSGYRTAPHAKHRDSGAKP